MVLPVDWPLKITLANGIGSPVLASVTLPETIVVWLNATWVKSRLIRKNNENLSDSVVIGEVKVVN